MSTNGLIMSNNGFDPENFITEAHAKGYKQVTWIAVEEGKVFTIAIRGSIGESTIKSKSQSLVFVPSTLH